MSKTPGYSEPRRFYDMGSLSTHSGGPHSTRRPPSPSHRSRHRGHSNSGRYATSPSRRSPTYSPSRREHSGRSRSRMISNSTTSRNNSNYGPRTSMSNRGRYEHVHGGSPDRQWSPVRRDGPLLYPPVNSAHYAPVRPDTWVDPIHQDRDDELRYLSRQYDNGYDHYDQYDPYNSNGYSPAPAMDQWGQGYDPAPHSYYQDNSNNVYY